MLDDTSAAVAPDGVAPSSTYLSETLDEAASPASDPLHHENSSQTTTSSTGSPPDSGNGPSRLHHPDSESQHPTSSITSIRSEWVNAIFGPDFFPDNSPPDYKPPSRGVGLAELSPYVSYDATIPPSPPDQKLGLTISRIPLGVYAHAVSPGSEASAAGVVPGSVLISINGVGLIGEPTHKALERLWQYDGFWGDGVEGPVVMTLIHGGRRYNAVFLTRAPWGISWATCGNFALVQRSYSFAQKAGIRRGCLIAGVNDSSLRSLDHASAATILKDLFLGGDEIRITLAYTPASSRTAGPLSNGEGNGDTKDKKEGVVQFIQSNMVCGSTRVAKSPIRPVSDLATRVSAGEVLPPLDIKRSQSIMQFYKLQENDKPTAIYEELPKLTNFYTDWEAIDCLTYCLKFHRAAFSEEAFLALSNEREVLGRCGVDDALFMLQFLGLLGDANEKVGNELVRVLVEMASENDNICVRLNYLMKSFLIESTALENLRSQLSSSLESKAEEIRARQSVDLLLNSSTVTDCKDKMTLSESHSTQETHSSDTPPPTPLRTKEENEIKPVVTVPETAKSKKKKKTRILRMFRGSKKHSDKRQLPVEQSNNSIPEIQPQPQESEETDMTQETVNVDITYESLSSLPAVDNSSKPTPILRNFISNSITAVDTWATISSFHQPAESMLIGNHIDNLDWFLQSMENISQEASKSLLKPLTQKITDAIQPWTPSKENSLRDATTTFRQRLKELNIKSYQRKSNPIINPVDAHELLDDVDPEDSFILPSAHIPLLIAWNLYHGKGISEVVHTTKIQFIALRGAQGAGETYSVQGAVGGMTKETPRSTLGPYFETTLHRWYDDNICSFETRGSLGYPKTLSINIVSHSDTEKVAIGYAWVTLPSQQQSQKQTIQVPIYSQHSLMEFDQHGDVITKTPELTLEIQVSSFSSKNTKKRYLLYKHGDDLRQETLSLQFLEICSLLLKSSGLDLKMKTFKCTPLSPTSGFVEWVEGSLPLSEICHAADGWYKYPSLHRSPQKMLYKKDNPIQNFLRDGSFDPDAPYWIEREVMDNYVKSCAGYCVATYLLGVGDRHLDNLLLTPRGHFLHCDFSFILGRDPKTYIPMRITEEMVLGMGGRESDNFAKFLSLAGASFVALRRHHNLRVLLSLLRLMVNSDIPDLSVNQSPEEALMAMRYRFRLDLSESDALTFMERLIESSIENKLWIAVDAIHSLGKHF